MPRLNRELTRSLLGAGMRIRAESHAALAIRLGQEAEDYAAAAASPTLASDTPGIGLTLERRAALLASHARAHQTAADRLGEENIRRFG